MIIGALLQIKRAPIIFYMTMPKKTLHPKLLLTGKLYIWICPFLKDFTYSQMVTIVVFHCKYKSFHPERKNTMKNIRTFPFRQLRLWTYVPVSSCRNLPGGIHPRLFMCGRTSL